MATEDSKQDKDDLSSPSEITPGKGSNDESTNVASEKPARSLLEEPVTPPASEATELEEVKEPPAIIATADKEATEETVEETSSADKISLPVDEPNTGSPTGNARRFHKMGLGLCIGAIAGILLTVAMQTVLQPSSDVSFTECLAQLKSKPVNGASAPQAIVVPFFNDPSGNETEHFVSALQSFDRTKNVKLLSVRTVPCFIPIDETSVLEGEAQAQNAAEQLSRLTGAKAIIWGEVFEADNRIKLFATYANGLDGTFYSKDQFAIPLAPSDEFGELVAAKIWLSDQRAVAGNSPQYGEKLKAVVAALETQSSQMQKGSSYQKGQMHYVLAQARFRLYELNGDASSVGKVIDGFAAASELFDRFDFSEEWAQAQNDLGLALLAVGKSKSSLPEIELAISSFRAALSQSNRARSPLKWAAQKTNLANALSVLGPQEANEAKLKEAVEAYWSALEVYTLESAPREWADLQHNLATALHSIGQKRKDSIVIRQAVEGYHLALEIRTPEISRTGFVDSQIGLAATLSSLAGLGAGDDTIGQAIDATRAALSQIDRNSNQTRWATLQLSLGIALLARAEVNPEINFLLEANAAFLASLQVFSRNEAPARWAVAQNNLGNVLKELGIRKSNAELIQAAIDAYEKSLEVFSDTSPVHAQTVVQNLSRSQQLLQKMTKGEN